MRSCSAPAERVVETTPRFRTPAPSRAGPSGLRSGGAEPFGGTYNVESPVTPESARWRTPHGSMNGRPTGNGVAS